MRALLSECGAPDEGMTAWLVDEVTRLRTLADDGRAYRADLLKEVEEEYIRSGGQRLETKRALWATASLDTLKAELEEYGGRAAARFKGGRVTINSEPANVPAPYAVPPAAYRV